MPSIANLAPCVFFWLRLVFASKHAARHKTSIQIQMHQRMQEPLNVSYLRQPSGRWGFRWNKQNLVHLLVDVYLLPPSG